MRIGLIGGIGPAATEFYYRNPVHSFAAAEQPSKSDSTRIGLSVVHDDQFDDAVKLLKNPAHRPQRVIGEDQMKIADRAGVTPRPGKHVLLILSCALWLLTGIGYLARP